MKNVIKLLLIVFLLIGVLSANAQNLNSYTHMEEYSTNEYKFNPYNLVYEFKPTTDKSLKKKHKNIDKLYKKKKYSEILNIESNFLPALYGLYINNENKKDYNSAINNLTKIREIYPDFNSKVISAKLISDLHSSKRYDEVIEEIKRQGSEFPYYNYYLADCYFNMGAYKEASLYAKQVKINEDVYVKAQEIVFKCLYRQNNIKDAYIIAKKLIDIDSNNPKQYLRAASCTTNNNEKLKYLYQARKLVSDRNVAFEINNTIAALEQLKIQNVVKNSKKYIEYPNWVEIVSPVISYGSDKYWINRQDMFYNATNSCMQNYSGGELSSCFASIISKQNTLNQQLMQQEQMRQENLYRQAILEQNERMIDLQREQNYNQVLINNSLRNINSNLDQQNYNLRNINSNLNQQNFNLQNINSNINQRNLELHRMNNGLFYSRF